MGKSIQATATGTVFSGPCKLLRVIVDPSTSDGSFTLRDGGAPGRIIVSGTKISANSVVFFLEIDHDCETNLYATIDAATLYCIIR